MRFEEFIGLLVLLALVVFPALALSLRLALKPIVESIVRLREAFVSTPQIPGDAARMARLEEEVTRLRAEVERLGSLEEFYGELAESTERPPLPDPDEAPDSPA